MSIIIQSITVHWNKDHRGGKNASLRNSISESFELPLEACICKNRDSIVVHEVRFHSYNNFEKCERVYFIEGGVVKIKGSIIKIDSELLQVYFKYSGYDWNYRMLTEICTNLYFRK